jgi:hypothetical protein
MEDFVKRVIEGNGITPTEKCIQAFEDNFSHAINIEWFDREMYYEAIFYKDNIEYIAIFEKDGTLKEYKSFLPNNYLPEAIKHYLEEKGEIMNVVLINKRNSIEYETIIRDKNLVRQLYLFTGQGKLIEKKAL